MKRIEILAEVLKPEEKELSILKRYFTSDCVSPKNCIEAMKIAMKQSFEAGQQSACGVGLNEWHRIKTFDDWFNKLEGGKK